MLCLKWTDLCVDVNSRGPQSLGVQCQTQQSTEIKKWSLTFVHFYHLFEVKMKRRILLLTKCYYKNNAT